MRIKEYSISQVGFPSIAAQSVYDMAMAEAWADAGFSATIIAKNKIWERKPRGFTGDIWDFYAVKRNFNIVKLLAPPRCTRFFQLRALRRIKGAAAFVFTQNGMTAYEAVKHRVPVILDRHGLLKPWEVDALQKVASDSHLLGVVTVTRTLREDYIEKIPALDGKIISWPNGVRLDYYQQAASKFQGKDTESFVAGYLGSFHKGKGLEIILELAPLCPDIEFHVYGGPAAGEAMAEIKRLYGVKDIPTNMLLKGFVPQQKVPDVMASFDVALLPNQKSVLMPTGEDIGNWTSPMKMFEYMAVGRAIIASDLPVLREVLDHERNAYLVECNDSHQWADALQYLKTHENERLCLGHTALQDIQNKYTWKNRVDKIISELAIVNKLTRRTS